MGFLVQSHRLRLVSISCFPRQVISYNRSVDERLTFCNSYTFSIDGHSLTIIEADGVETQPLTVDSLTIFAAQRYSVVVTMDQPVDNYCKGQNSSCYHIAHDIWTEQGSVLSLHLGQLASPMALTLPSFATTVLQMQIRPPHRQAAFFLMRLT